MGPKGLMGPKTKHPHQPPPKNSLTRWLVDSLTFLEHFFFLLSTFCLTFTSNIWDGATNAQCTAFSGVAPFFNNPYIYLSNE